MNKALEAAFNAVMSRSDMPSELDPEYDRWLFDASITDYLSALAEDEETVERVARAVWDDKEPETRVWEEKHEIMKDEWRRTARAALRALKETKL